MLALTMYEDDAYFFEMLRASTCVYVPKRATPDELVSAIRAISQGDVFLYPSLAARLVQNYLGQDESDVQTSLSELTPREQEILTLIVEGLTSPEIASKLIIGVKTVDRHRENIMRKLNLHNGVELVKYDM